MNYPKLVRVYNLL